MPKSSNIVLPESRVFSALWGGAHTTIRCLNRKRTKFPSGGSARLE
jgi:hypothetical protein